MLAGRLSARAIPAHRQEITIMQTSQAIRPLGLSVRRAYRQVWLAGLGAAVVTRDWAEKEAGKVFGTLVREGTVVEARAMRFVGSRVDGSVGRANEIIGRARSTLQAAVRDYAEPVMLRVREALPNIGLPSMLRAVPVRSARAPQRKSAKRAGSVKRARVVKRAKAVTKRAAKR
jgi:hypothetical protein